MKKLIAAALAFSSLTAFAGNPKVFTGKYEVQHSNGCDRDGGTRAYIKTTAFNGRTSLEIQYYSDEAVLTEIPLTSGKRPAVGSSNFTETVKVSYPNSTTLNVSVVTDGISYNRRINYVTDYTVVKKGNVVTVTEATDGRVDNTCVLLKK